MFRALALCAAILVAAVTNRAEQTRGSTAAPSASRRIGEYRMDVATIREPGGLAGLRVAVRNSSDGGLVRRFETVHEKPFHLFVVGRDLRFFRHLYPTLLRDGFLEAREPIPPGEYLVAADFRPSGGSPQFLQHIVDLRGNLNADLTGVRGDSRGPLDDAYDIVTNVRIQPLPGIATAGKATAFHVMLSRTEDGRPIVNLEPYLGTGGHLLAVNEDLTEVVHAHASTDDLPMSLLTFEMTLPKAGGYAVWVQFQRFGETLTARLAVTAR